MVKATTTPAPRRAGTQGDRASREVALAEYLEALRLRDPAAHREAFRLLAEICERHAKK
jgi:hypothetical protein